MKTFIPKKRIFTDFTIDELWELGDEEAQQYLDDFNPPVEEEDQDSQDDQENQDDQEDPPQWS
jgi:hypothetical protein